MGLRLSKGVMPTLPAGRGGVNRRARGFGIESNLTHVIPGADTVGMSPQPCCPDCSPHCQLTGLATGQAMGQGGGWWGQPYHDGFNVEAAVFWGDECCPDCSRCPICQRW